MIHVGDIGTVITITPSGTTDITGATAVSIYYRKPSGSTGTWTASLVGNTIQYTTIAGDIDEFGTWNIQGQVVSAAWTGVSTVTDMTVGENLSV